MGSPPLANAAAVVKWIVYRVPRRTLGIGLHGDASVAMPPTRLLPLFLGPDLAVIGLAGNEARPLVALRAGQSRRPSPPAATP